MSISAAKSAGKSSASSPKLASSLVPTLPRGNARLSAPRRFSLGPRSGRSVCSHAGAWEQGGRYRIADLGQVGLLENPRKECKKWLGTLHSRYGYIDVPLLFAGQPWEANMIRRVLIALQLLVFSTACPVFAQRGGPGRGGGQMTPAAGTMLPNVDAFDEQGEKFSTASLRGSYTVLVFGCLT